MIRACRVVKKFGNFCALDSFDMHVEKGSIYGLVGPNGAGKTTIMNHITGALKPDDGTIEIYGSPVWENDELKQKVLSIADEWYYYGSYNIKEMANFYESVYKNFSRERYERLGTQLAIDENRQISRLSKGMKKQVAFRIVLSCMPEILILDEPLDGLDPVMRKQIMSIIINDVSERDMTVLVSSHNLRELEDICDHVGIIHNGRMVMEKPLYDLKGSVHKYQLVFGGEFPAELKGKLGILHCSQIGSVYTAIIKGDANISDNIIKSYSPVVCERVSLTLEEVFIYELGGLGYDFNNILA